MIGQACMKLDVGIANGGNRTIYSGEYTRI